MATDLTVAHEIARQMGGTRWLTMMIGAHGFCGDEKMLMFSFKGSPKANKIRIAYNYGSDDYKIEIFKIGRAPEYKVKTVFDGEGFYCDDLQRVFESTTGLYLTF